MRTEPSDTGRVFVIRMLGTDGEASRRGHVTDGVTGAYRAFTCWQELTSFLGDQLAAIPNPEEESP